MDKLLIDHVMVCDGTGREPFPGEVLLEGEKIVRVSGAYEGSQPMGEVDAQVMDGQGMTLTPGFIDAHRHCDLAALYDPGFGRLELAQGITTAVMGNCGLAPAPCEKPLRSQLYAFLEPCLGAAPETSFFPRVSDFIHALEEKPHSLNLGILGATGAITTAAKGFANVPFDPASRKTAEGYVRDAMEAGALGLSCGIMYTPECYSTLEDFAFLAGIAGEYGGYLTSHIRGEGNSLTPSVEEVLEIGRQAGVPVNISHFKVTGLNNHGWGIQRAIEAIEKARASGQDATADAYPYTGGSTTILSLVPPTVLEKAKGDVAGFLATKEGEALFREEILQDFPDWDNMVYSIGWDRVIISSVQREEDREFTGKSMAQAAEEAHMTESALFCRLVAGNQGRVGVIVMSMAQEDVDRVLCLPYVSLISDSLYGGGGMPHPRLYGSFPKFLREYVGEKKLLSFGEAVKKMTGLPAKRLGLNHRGTIEAGNYADLLLFQPDRFTDRATWENPKQLSTGLSAVFVNGRIPEALPGKIIKKQ